MAKLDIRLVLSPDRGIGAFEIFLAGVLTLLGYSDITSANEDGQPRGVAPTFNGKGANLNTI